MSAADLVRRLHQHRQWSNAQLRAVAATLSDAQLRRRFEVGRGSAWSTLVHLYAAELVWLDALHGQPDTPLANDDAFASLEELQIAWTALDRRWRRHLDDLTDAELARPVRKRSTAFGVGRVWETPASDVLLHVCTHAQYTTAQLVNLFRRLGVPPDALPDPQLMTMSRRERMSPPAAADAAISTKET